MDAPHQAPPTTPTNPFLSGTFAPVEAESTCLDLEVHGSIPEGVGGSRLCRVATRRPSVGVVGDPLAADDVAGSVTY
jgi:hypothetical protein